MSKLVGKFFRCSPSVDLKIKEWAKKENMSESKWINEAIHYYLKHEGRDYPELAKLFDAVIKGNLQSIVEESKRTRIAVNQVAKESQMNLEFWNDFYVDKGDGTLVTTDVKKANEVQQAEANIQNRILYAQQKKRG